MTSNLNYSDESTVVFAEFAGRRRKFELTIDGIGELERVCNAGVGAIMMRIGSHSFYAHDIWEPIRLGLEGGGASETEATALVMRYRTYPLRPYLELAAAIISAHVNGAPLVKKTEEKPPMRPPVKNESQETYPNSMQSAEHSAGRPPRLDA